MRSPRSSLLLAFLFLPAALSLAFPCTVTADCPDTLVGNANKYCASGLCGFRCRSGFRLSETAPTCTLAATTTAAPAATTCAPTYTGGATTVRGTGTLPKPTQFVSRQGQQLRVGGQNYRIVGQNIYWLCSDENVPPVGAPPTKTRVREALAIAVAMGANTPCLHIRIHTCGTSVGPNTPFNWEQSLNNFNDARANHGGKYDFLDFVGASRSNNGVLFYTSAAAIAAYGTYIQRSLSRVNQYTGISYAQDPTILAWETGNELGGYINSEAWPPASWTNQTIDFIRAIDTNHLILDGTNGFWNYSSLTLFRARSDGSHAGQSSQRPRVDIVSDHGYPRNLGILNTELGLATAANKAFVIGEYDWRTGGSVSLASYLSRIESSGSYLGDMIWNVMGHDSQCCAFVQHNDGYSLYYPNGNTAALRANILQVVRHWYRVTGRAVPNSLPAVACPQPVF
ncbi:hypothetical protein JCM10213v2_005801 [Rhodosporidiobolus nylandii]